MNLLRLIPIGWHPRMKDSEEYSNAAAQAWNDECNHRARETARVLRLKRVCDDMLSTFREDDKEVLVTAERQEAWKAEVEKCFDPNIDPRLI